jgi:hypothetical protein
MAKKKTNDEELIEKPVVIEEKEVEKVAEAAPVVEESVNHKADYKHKELPSLMALRKKFGK